MLENDRMETASTEVTSIRRQNDIEKSKWNNHWYFIGFESRIHVEISSSNWYHNFNVDSPFKIDVISTNFPSGISPLNQWRINKDVSNGILLWTYVISDLNGEKFLERFLKSNGKNKQTELKK